VRNGHAFSAAEIDDLRQRAALARGELPKPAPPGAEPLDMTRTDRVLQPVAHDGAGAHDGALSTEQRRKPSPRYLQRGISTEVPPPPRMAIARGLAARRITAHQPRQFAEGVLRRVFDPKRKRETFGERMVDREAAGLLNERGRKFDS
jgi:hypothetical protein